MAKKVCKSDAEGVDQYLEILGQRFAEKVNALIRKTEGCQSIGNGHNA
jgi:hypothetical protein